ncbi:unnamed protein product [Effrenium voratum]|nr:unnamed protein product [Effrenium voratum]
MLGLCLPALAKLGPSPDPLSAALIANFVPLNCAILCSVTLQDAGLFHVEMVGLKLGSERPVPQAAVARKAKLSYGPGLVVALPSESLVGRSLFRCNLTSGTAMATFTPTDLRCPQGAVGSVLGLCLPAPAKLAPSPPRVLAPLTWDSVPFCPVTSLFHVVALPSDSLVWSSFRYNLTNQKSRAPFTPTELHSLFHMELLGLKPAAVAHLAGANLSCGPGLVVALRSSFRSNLTFPKPRATFTPTDLRCPQRAVGSVLGLCFPALAKLAPSPPLVSAALTADSVPLSCAMFFPVTLQFHVELLGLKPVSLKPVPQTTVTHKTGAKLSCGPGLVVALPSDSLAWPSSFRGNLTLGTARATELCSPPRAAGSVFAPSLTLVLAALTPHSAILYAMTLQKPGAASVPTGLIHVELLGLKPGSERPVPQAAVATLPSDSLVWRSFTCNLTFPKPRAAFTLTGLRSPPVGKGLCLWQQLHTSLASWQRAWTSSSGACKACPFRDPVI